MNNGFIKCKKLCRKNREHKLKVCDVSKYNSFDERMRKVKELTISACNELYINLHDCANLIESRKNIDASSLVIDLNHLMQKVETYVENLANDDRLTLSEINQANKEVDCNVSILKDFIEEHDSVLASELKGGVSEKIKNTGYKALFSKKKMELLWEEKNYPKFEKTQRQINEGKAISAMFSNVYSKDAETKMIEALRLAGEQA